MANRNNMGPNNEGSMSGRGLGDCGTNASPAEKIVAGLGMGAALGRGMRKGMNQGGSGRGQRGFFRNNGNNNSNNNSE